jgi:hypothetical protein
MSQTDAISTAHEHEADAVAQTCILGSPEHFGLAFEQHLFRQYGNPFGTPPLLPASPQLTLELA